jgi:hypothetical protein
MRASNLCRPALLLLLVLLTIAATAAAGDHDFRRDFDVTWGGNARFRDGEREVELSLDRRTGSHGAWLSRRMQILCIGLNLSQRLISLLQPVESAGEDDEP